MHKQEKKVYQLRAHRGVLDIRCPALMRRNVSKMKQKGKETNIDVMPNTVTPKAMQRVLEFIYTGEGNSLRYACALRFMRSALHVCALYAALC